MKKTTDFKFYWIGEDTEIFAASSVEELDACFRDSTEDPLTEANKGETWGDAPETGIVWDQEDEGKKWTYREAFDAWFGNNPRPAQIATTYV